jgi:hypothetical protein
MQEVPMRRALVPANRYASRDEPKRDSFGKSERIEWAVVAIASSILVWLNDQLVLTSSIWLFGIVVFGQFVLPPIFRSLHDYVNDHHRFWLAVVCGWGLVAGLPVGALLGVLIPYVNDCGISSLLGGTIGLLVGPICAAVQGLVIASIVNGIVWLATRKSLTQHIA